MHTKLRQVNHRQHLRLQPFSPAPFPVYAAPAWSLNQPGVKIEENTAKQAYVAKRMDAYFHPAQKPADFAAPDGWTYTKYQAQNVTLEKLTNPKGDANRTVLQLHGGGYVVPLHNGYKNLAVRQAVLADAKDTYMVNYRLAPQNPYPAALEDALTAYKSVLAQGTKPQQIVPFW
mgnify:CR=1 FL=1